jgi:peptide/nickel transport system permease protein
VTPGADSFVDRLKHMVLPVAVLAVQFIGIYARQTRSAMLEVLNEDYVTTARAKGLADRRVTGRHILPNALIPVITIIGLSLPLLITGAVVTEIVFSWTGIGRLTLDSIYGRDYPVLMGIVLIIGIAVTAANLLVDMAYALVDPRIRYQ